MKHERFLIWCDRVIVFACCALIYFLPISIALIEVFMGIAIFFYLLKRSVIFCSQLSTTETPLDFSSTAEIFIRSFKPKDNYLNLPIGCYILVCFISIFTSQYPGISWKGFLGKVMEGTFLFFAFIEAINSSKRLKIFLNIFFISMGLIFVDGIYQYFVGQEFIRGEMLIDKRISASFRAHNDFGAYLVMVSQLLIGIALMKLIGRAYHKQDIPGNQTVSVQKRIFLLCLIILSIICLALTFSRGAWLGFILSLFFFAGRKPKFVLIMLILFSLVGFITIQLVKNMRQDFQSFSKAMTSNGRLDYWCEAGSMIRDFPVLGVGINAYSEVGREYKISWGGYPHNCYLQMAAEIGLVGLSVFIWFMVRLFKNGFKAVARMKSLFLVCVLLGALAGLFGFFFHAFWDTIFYSVSLNTLMWIFVGLVVASEKIDSVKQ